MAQRPPRQGGVRRGLAAGYRTYLVCYRQHGGSTLKLDRQRMARRLDSADKFARTAKAAANRLPVIFKGAATHLSPDPLRMGRWEAPLGRVACPYAAEPETSNLQRLHIYGVSPGIASRNFRAHRTVGITCEVSRYRSPSFFPTPP